MAVVSGQSDSSPKPDLRRILHLRVPVTVKLAQRRMPLAKILRLTPGSILEFPKRVNEPLELLVNNKTIASGEVVKSNDRLGVRVTHIGAPDQLIHSLGARHAM